MSNPKPPFQRTDTVEIRPTHPIHQMHGATATVIRILPRTVLVHLHSPDHTRDHADLGVFCRIPPQHLELVEVGPYVHPPGIDWQLADRLIETLPPRERLPNAMPCPIHPEDTIYLRTSKNGRWWYSHKRYSPDFYFGYEWCKGYLNQFYQSKPWPDLPLTEDQ